MTIDEIVKLVNATLEEKKKKDDELQEVEKSLLESKKKISQWQDMLTMSKHNYSNEDLFKALTNKFGDIGMKALIMKSVPIIIESFEKSILSQIEKLKS